MRFAASGRDIRPGVVRRLLALANSLPSYQQGVGLAETLVALVIMGSALSAGLSAFAAGSNSVNVVSSRLGLRSVAQTQLEYTKAYPFAAGSGDDIYPTITPPEGFAVTVVAQGVPGADGDLQQILVTVSHNGKSETLSTLKANR